MKKILFAILSIWAMVSCTDDALVNTSPTTTAEGKVAINLSLYLPELSQLQSRAFSNSDADGYLSYLQSCPLQLVVFDENGVLVEAHDITPTGNDRTDQVNFKIELETSADPRRIHCIVNSPVAVGKYQEFGLESDLIGELSKALSDEKEDDTDHQDAYWQLVELTHIADDDYTEGKLTRIPMIRNFVKISVNTSITDASHFELLGYAVVNEWDKGTVAPYKGSGAFASLNNGERMKDYTTITNTEKYEGVWPSDAQLINTDASTVTFKEFSSSTADGATTYTGESYYMYERRNTYVSDDIPPTYLLIKGKYKKNEGGAESYYKLDLVYDLDDTGVNKQYYNLLRNFHYQINIEDVIGNGYATAKEAAEHAASNNLSGAIDIRDLTNISDAVDRLFVSYTDYTVVDNTNPVAIKYRFLNNENKFTNTGVVTSIKEQTACPIKDVYYKKADGTIVYIYDDGVKVEGYTANTDIPQDTDGWSTVYVTFEKIPTDFKVYTNVLTFACQGLIREVDYNLRRIMYMMVECDPNSIAKGVGNSVTANILIPVGITGENDPYQLFPLNFLVEAENMTLSPDATTNGTNITLSPSEMPVFTGTSIIPDKAATNKQTFRYQRTVTNAEYQALSANTVERTVMYNGQEIKGTYVQIPCHFLTNTSVSATAVYAQNEYFTLIKEGFFVNTGTNIGNLKIKNGNVYGEGQQVTVSFTALSAGTYTIAPTGMTALTGTETSVTLEENQVYTGTFSTNDWGSNVSATVTLTLGNDVETNTVSSTRNILPMTATTTYNSSPLPSGTMLKVYTDEASANSTSDNYATTVSDEALNNGSSAAIAGLESSSSLWFVYEDNDHIYVASTTAIALAGGTAELVFVLKDKPLKMTAEFGNGTQYYGIGKTFTLTFTTNKAGTYTLASDVLTFASDDVTISNNQFTVNAAGTYTFTCTTTTWSNVASATITKVDADGNQENVDGNPVNVKGETRNVLKFGALTANDNAPQQSSTSLNVYSSGGNSIGTITYEQLTAGTAEVIDTNGVWANISDPDNGSLCYFTYSQRSGRKNYNYKSDTLIIPQAMVSGNSFNFSQQ